MTRMRRKPPFPVTPDRTVTFGTILKHPLEPARREIGLRHGLGRGQRERSAEPLHSGFHPLLPEPSLTHASLCFAGRRTTLSGMNKRLLTFLHAVHLATAG